MKTKRFYIMFILLMVLLQLSQSKPAIGQQNDELESLFQQMTLEEKIGQVFLVSFEGTVDSSSVQEFIRDLKVGGFIINEGNGRFSNSSEEPASVQVARLTNALQESAWKANLKESSDGSQFFIPLFLAADHEGNGAPFTHIRSGMTGIPSQLSIGATWSIQNAETVGHIVGQELSAIGVNMLLGPVIDVVDEPAQSWKGDMTLRVFGGNPQWVGQLGQAYIKGVHEGSDERIVTVAKHFPGHGDSNRNPDEDVAYLNHTLNDLRQLDLIPFFKVTEGQSPIATTDAIMSSHISYNRNGAEGPVSVSYEGGIGAVTQILREPEFDNWRENGLVVADSLGAVAIKKYYDPTEKSFPHTKIAFDALMAGNDLLILAGYSPGGIFSEAFKNTKADILFFRDEYQRNPDFRDRVDDAVRKILRLKMKLYPQLSLEDVLVNETLIKQRTGQPQNTELIRNIAKNSITLLFPNSTNDLPSPPKSGEQILVATHNYSTDDQTLSTDKLEKLLIELKQVDPNNIESIPFFRTEQEAGLVSYLYRATSLTDEEYKRIDDLVNSADWIIFALLDQDWGPSEEYDSSMGTYQEANTLKTFLSQYHGNANIIVVAFGPPPFTIDSTDVTKIAAYYGVYSKIDPFPEIVVRSIFREIEPRGAAPIDVAGVGYNLTDRLKPDPKSPYKVNFIDGIGPNDIKKNDKITLKTTQIFDYNGNVVPDGTMLIWEGTYSDGTLIKPIDTISTINGIGEAGFRFIRSGQITFQANNGDAFSEKFVVNVVDPTPTNTPVVATEIPDPSETPFTPSVTPSSTSNNLSTFPSSTPPFTPTNISSVLPSATPAPTSTSTPNPTQTPVPFVDRPGGTAIISAIATVIAAIIGLIGVFIAQGRVSVIGTKSSYKRRLKTLHNNLNLLEEQKANYGLDVPIKLINEIQMVEKEIAELEEKLRES